MINKDAKLSKRVVRPCSFEGMTSTKVVSLCCVVYNADNEKAGTFVISLAVCKRTNEVLCVDIQYTCTRCRTLNACDKSGSI